MNCKTKNKVKLILDIVLLALTLTLFNKSFISMKYHEVTGLVIIGIMLIHIGVNIKTAKAMCVKFTRLPVALKTCIIADVLLLINFLWFGISGVLCSKTILTSISSSNNIFKLYHMAAGASALILLGIHVGLHICRRPMQKKGSGHTNGHFCGCRSLLYFKLKFHSLGIDPIQYCFLLSNNTK